jgi:hypothetical protein
MNTSRRTGIVLPLISIAAVFAWSANAEEPHKPATKAGQGKPTVQTVNPGAGRSTPGQARGPQNGRVANRLPSRNFGGHAYRGRQAWEGGRWRHEVHNGRDGWWWDVGGAWYFYPQQMDGPPAYVSDVEVVDDVAGPDGPPVAAGYAPPPGAYGPPPGAYPPPPPPPDPAAGVVGGAVVGGLLGGLLTGRPVGAAVGMVTGATVGGIVGAQAAQRQGYWLAQGNCYYRYPSGQYVQVDPRTCY